MTEIVGGVGEQESWAQERERRRRSGLRECEAPGARRFASAAHDAAKPLVVIQIEARRLAAALPSAEPMRAAAEMIAALSGDALAILEAFVVSMRSGAARENDRQPLRSLLQAVVAAARRLHPGRPVEVTPVVPEVWIEQPVELSNALLNLVDNAMHACRPHEPIRIDACWERGEREAQAIRIEVMDSGTGMCESTRARATEAWFTTRAGGTGLGLASARARVECLGGHLELVSRPGQGTRARIRLPVDIRAGAGIDVVSPVDGRA